MANAIPIGAYDVRVDPASNLRRITPQAPTDSMSGAVENLANAVQFKAQQDGVVQASKAMADARVQITQHVNDAQNSYQPGEDFAGRLAKDFRDYHDKALKQFSNPYAKKAFDSQMRGFGAQVAESATLFQAHAQVASRIQTQADANSTAAIAVKSDPSQFEEVYGEQLSAINALQVDPETRIKLATHLRDTMSVEAAKTLGERDPYGTMVALTKPQTGNPALDRLTAQGREQVQEHILTVQRMVQAQDDHAFAVQERNQRKASDNLLKNGIELAQNGQLSPQWIEQHHATFEPQAYEYLYGLLRGKGETTDPHTYAPLIERALKGEDVSEEAKGALYSGAIKLDDYTRLLEKIQTPRQNWVKRGAEYISTSSAVSQLNPDPAAAQRKAKMLDEWDQWTGENPKASDSQAREAYMGIVRSYALIDYDKLSLVKPLPKFVVGSRTAMDFEATMKATVKAFDDGQISKPEANRQAQLILEWEEAFKKTQGEQKAPPK